MKDLGAIVRGVADDMVKGGEKAGAAIVRHFGDIGKGLEDSAKAYRSAESDIKDGLGKISSGAAKDAEHDAGSLGKDMSHGDTGGDFHGGNEGGDFHGGNKGGHDSEGTKNTEGASDPVDVVSGQMLTSAEDVALPGLLPLTLRRAYASGYRNGQLFGPGWSSTLDQRLVTDDDGIHFLGDDAQVLNYPAPDQADREVLPVAGARWPLTWDRAADVIEIRDPFSGWSRRFNTARRDFSGREVRDLALVEDRNGNRIEFIRTKDGVPSEVRHSGGYRVMVGSAVQGDGVRVTGLWLADGSPDGALLAAYGYDDRGRLTAITDSGGVPFAFEYDQAGRIIAWTDRLGHRYDYAYDAEGRVIRGEGPEGFLSAAFSYDTDARVTTVTNGNGEPTAYHYDEHQHITAIVDALGHATRFEHDRHGREIARTGVLGHTIRREYDERGDLVGIAYPDGAHVRVRYNALHQPVEFTDQTGSAWRYEFDGAGNLLAEIDPLGARARHTYDEHGRLTSSADASGNTTRYETNAVGLPTAVTGPLGAVSRIERDAFGDAVAVTDPNGHTTRSGFRPGGEPLWREFPDGSREEWAYDAEGNQVRYRSPSGAVTSYEYGPMAVRVAEVRADGARYAFAYDAERHLVQVTGPDGLNWNYEYGPGGQLSREVDFSGRETRYRYDAAGRLTERVNGAGQRAVMTRDGLGRVTRRELEGSEAVTYSYDRAGRLTAARALGRSGSGVSLDREYDAAGRLLAETVSGRVMRYRYDPDGRLIERVTPSGARSAWSYDANGAPEALTAGGGALAMAYDPVGQEVSRSVGTNGFISQAWDSNRRLSRQALWARQPSAAPDGRGPGDRGPGDRGQPLVQRRYGYSPDSYPTSATYVGDGDSRDGGWRYSLDPFGRVTLAASLSASSEGDEEYAYDRAGRVTRARWVGDQSAQGERRYQGTRLVRAGRTRYEYDAQGRMISKTRRTLSGQARRWTFTWDADDRLTEAAAPDGTTWRYGYDPCGRRVSKQRLGSGGDAGKPTYFSWHGIHLAEQAQATESGGIRSTTWDWEPGTDRVAAQTRRTWAADAPGEEIDAEFHAIVTDWAGTPTELLSPGGQIDWRADTSVWGAPRTSTSVGDGPGPGCPLRFPGQYHDQETGLDYNVFRYYDPETARFLTPDPLGLHAQADDYAYAPNPLAWIDPLGLAHHAVIQHWRPDPSGNTYHLIRQYGLVSGHTTPEEAALGPARARMAVHTESRAMRMLGAEPTVPIPNDPYATDPNSPYRTQPGDHVKIIGELPPCNQCKGVMNRANANPNVPASISYHWPENGSWRTWRPR